MATVSLEELELWNLLSHSGLFTEISIVNYPFLAQKKFQDLILIDNFLYQRKYLQMKISEILGYSANDIEKWSEDELIKNCQEHFIYTRPTTPLPSNVKENKKATGDVGNVTKPTKPKKISDAQAARNLLAGLLEDARKQGIIIPPVK